MTPPVAARKNCRARVRWRNGDQAGQRPGKQLSPLESGKSGVTTPRLLARMTGVLLAAVFCENMQNR